MNNRIYRLVFSKRLGMLVPVSEAARSHSCKSPRRSLRRVVAAALALAPAAVLAAQPAGLQLNNATNAAIDAARSSATQLTIQQNAAKAILNWNQLNLNRGENLIFDQQGNRNWAALNRIHDINPSVIAGRVQADGHLYFVNTSGIIFGEGAQVNVGSLTASSLDISDSLFNAGILSAPGAASFTGTGGFVRVEAGAALTAASGGRVMLLGKDVENSGVINTPDGQTILGAGEKVYLQDSADPAGLLVEVDAGGSATNLGEIIAQRGNVTLVGLAVNQQGRISASTSVRANGSVHLLARDTVDQAALLNGQLQATRGGVLNVAQGSETVIDVEAADTEEVLDAQVLNPSRVLMNGGIVSIDGSIVAHGGEVSATAAYNPSDTTALASSSAVVSAPRIFVGDNARIDVSGVDASAPMSRHQLEIQLFSEQLKDTPILRDSPLFGQKIYVDARKGAGITDIAPFVALKGKTIAERLSAGGTVSLNAGSGDVLMADGAVVDVSGGSTTYEAGYVRESSVLYQGKSIPVSETDRSTPYEGLTDVYTVTDAKWGVTRNWNLSPNGKGTYYASYSEGADAGTVNISAGKAVLGGNFKADTEVALSTQRTAVPLGGSFNLDVVPGIGVLPPSVSLVESLDNPLANNFSAVGAYDETTQKYGTGDALSQTQQDKLQVETGIFGNDFNRVTIDAPSSTISVDSEVVAAAGGSLTLKTANTVAINADITTHGGDITINGGDIAVADGVTVSTAGLYTNDTPGVAGALTAPVMLDGGDVSLTALGTTTLGTDSRIDASAGAWLHANGKLKGGKGGNIALQGVEAVEAGQLRSYGFSKGGSLSLGTLLDAQIGGQNPGLANVFWLSQNFFGQGGFSKYSVTASAQDAAMTVGDDGVSVIRPQMETLTARAGIGALESGASMDGVARATLLVEEQRTPASIALKSNGTLTVTENTVIRTDAPRSSDASVGAISLSSVGQMTILGDLIAPAGSINAAITGGIGIYTYDNTRSLFVGENATLSAAGHYAVARPDGSGLIDAEVIDGGSITLDGGTIGVVVLKEGSLLDVSGASGEADVAMVGGIARKTLYGAAGSISVSARNGFVLDGTLDGHADGAGAGGTLTLAMGGQASDPTAQGGQHPDAARVLGFVQDKTVRAAGIYAGDALGDADPLLAGGLIGKGVISAEQVAAGGFDRFNAKVGGIAGDSITLESGLQLKVTNGLKLDAPVLAVTGGGEAVVAASNVTLTNTSGSSGSPVAGSASLKVDADFIDLVGKVTVSGVSSTTLSATTDIRARQIDTAKRSLQTPGELVLNARQIYPATASQFTFEATGSGSRIEVQSNGATPQAVLSAGGKLILKADEIVQGGTLLAPLGNITLEADDITLAPGSLTSVSAAGQLIPYGVTGLGGLSWIAPDGSVYNLSSTVSDANVLPEKKVALNGDSVVLQEGATIDLSGGGDVFAYEWVEGIGGSADILGQAGVYAVLPSAQGEYAPYDPTYNKAATYTTAANGTRTYTYTDTDLNVGDAVYLSGIAGLAEGVYTLLPARYALLPGAFMVQTASSNLPAGLAAGQLDGSTLISGYRTTLEGSSRDAAYSTFRVTDGSVFYPAAGTKSGAPSEYRVSTGNAFFADQAVNADRAIPRLVSDAGQLVLSASDQLTLGASLLTGKADGARGALVDIDTAKISVVSAVGADDGTVQLTAESLNDLGAESLLLGGTRTQNDDGFAITTGASTVAIANDAAHALQVDELIAVARDQVTVADNAVIRAAVYDDEGALVTPERYGKQTLSASGDGALLAVSRINDLEFTRAVSGTPATGTLDIGNGAVIDAGRSLVLDSTKTAVLEGNVSVGSGGSATLGANRILLGSPSAALQGLRVDNALLAGLGSLAKVTLNSAENLEIHGPVNLGNSELDLTFNTSGIKGVMASGENAEITANTLTLKNTTGKTAVAAAGNGSLEVQADTLVLEGGSTETTVGIGGFSQVNLAASGDVQLSGAGEARIEADSATITSARITAATGADYAITASGALATAMAASPDTLTAADGLGAKVTLQGSTLSLGGAVELPSGQLTAVATQGDLDVVSSANIKAGSVAVAFDNETEYTPGGSISLQSDKADVNVASGAMLDVSGAGDADAGALKISAVAGTATVDGALAGSGGGADGSFVLDTKTLADFGGLNDKLNAGGFTASRALRIRSGDVTIAADDTVTAHNFVLSADSGKVDVYGTVDASGTNGGNIAIYAEKDLTLQAGGQLLAYAAGSEGTGGSVMLSSDSGTVSAAVFDSGGNRLSNAALINVNGATKGEVAFRASRTGGDNTAFSPVTTTGSATAYTASGVTLTRGVVVAFKPHINNSGATPTLNGKTLKKNGGDALAAADLKMGNTYLAVYDGTSFQLVTGTSSGSAAVGTGLAVDTAATAAITGAGKVALEAVRSYTGYTDLNAKAQLQIAADTQAFTSKAAAISGAYAATMDGLAATLTPGVEARSAGNLTVSADWNLDSATNGTLAMAGAGVLTLKAAGNLTLNGTLSDGFTGVTAADAVASKLVAGESWGYRLVAGSDTSSADPLATVASSSSGNLTLASNKLIRTGTGDISIATGGSLTMGNESSVIYTTGQAASTLDGFTAPNGSMYLTGGGDIDIDVMGNINGKFTTSGTQQTVNNWLFRQGGGTSSKQVTWWVRPDLFKQGVATLGGGNVNINAGGSITNFSASAATTARYASTDNYRVDGGGDVNVGAGADIYSGVYFAGKGDIRIHAGGAIQSSSNTFGTTIALMDASARVSAVRGALIETVFNPTLWAQSATNASNQFATNGDSSFFQTYGADSAFRLDSLTGDATLGLDSGKTERITSSTNQVALSGAANAATALEVHPGTVEARAFGGDIKVNRLVMAPDADGNLSLLAAGDVTGNGVIAMSDADAAQLPSVAAPLVAASNVPAAILRYRQEHAATPVHADDSTPVRIVARDGSISLLGITTAGSEAGPGLSSPKAVHLTAGQDIRLYGKIQHVGSNDISVLEAGRDYAPASSSSLTLGGPGNLLLQAGREVNLGSSVGVVTVANTDNPNLPEEGASITVLAGLGEEGGNIVEYIDAYIDPQAHVPAWLLSKEAYVRATVKVDDPEYLEASKKADTLEKYMSLKEQERVTKLAAFEVLTSDDGYRTKTAISVMEYLCNCKLVEKSSQLVVGTIGTDNIEVASGSSPKLKVEDVVGPAELEAYMQQYLALDENRQAVFAYRHFSSELLASGKGYAEAGNHDRGDSAIATLFPASRSYEGDLLMFSSQLRTLRDGNIDILTPGGFINAGVPTSSGTDIGIVTEFGGAIRAFAESGFQVEQSRVITQYGSDITVWVNNGDIDAGRGSKSAVSVPERVVSTDADGNTSIEVKAAAVGSGIRAQTYDPDGPAGPRAAPEIGSVALIAPRGILNASEAGIAAGNFLAVAVQVLGTENIQVSGTSSGVPLADAGGLAGGLGNVSNVASDATKAAAEEVAKQVAQNSNPFDTSKSFLPSFITVEVIGLGDEKEKQ